MVKVMNSTEPTQATGISEIGQPVPTPEPVPQPMSVDSLVVLPFFLAFLVFFKK